MTMLTHGQNVTVEVAYDDFLTNDQCGCDGPVSGTFRGPVDGHEDLHFVETKAAVLQFYTDEIKAA